MLGWHREAAGPLWGRGEGEGEGGGEGCKGGRGGKGKGGGVEEGKEEGGWGSALELWSIPPSTSNSSSAVWQPPEERGLPVSPEDLEFLPVLLHYPS